MKKFLTKIKTYFFSVTQKLKSYIKKLLFPLYLFPIKLITYSTYYILRFLIKLILAFFGLILDCFVFPFKSTKNFLKSIVYVGIVIYFLLSVVVIIDYLDRQYGKFDNVFCGFEAKKKLQTSVVRIIGGYGEGSGFFISPTEVVTNFHVIADEPSPKVVFPDGKIETPEKIVGDKNMDLALLTLKNSYPDLVYELPILVSLVDDEPVLSAGYPLGSEITGDVTIVRGNFIDYRKSRKDYVSYIQTNISLVPGMSGGPLVDLCGKIVGVNTMGLAGISLFITAADVNMALYHLTDQEIVKINVDPSKSPEDAVYAFYTHLKARRMEEGFKLLSVKYLEKTNFTEWTNRFMDILDVDVIKTEKFEDSKDTVFVKFGTTNWVDGEVDYHYYEGTWQTILDDGIYKMEKSKIKEVLDPQWSWFYE